MGMKVKMFVCLFKKDDTAEMFDIESSCVNGDSLQLNIYEEANIIHTSFEEKE